VDETAPIHAQDAYGLSKWLGEEIVAAAVRQGGLSAVSLRMPWVQSPGTFAAQVGPRRKMAESVRDLWSYIDARDAAQGICKSRSNNTSLKWPICLAAPE
jgi:nucleoside-diphosphate-sugar epimerase